MKFNIYIKTIIGIVTISQLLVWLLFCNTLKNSYNLISYKDQKQIW